MEPTANDPERRALWDEIEALRKEQAWLHRELAEARRPPPAAGPVANPEKAQARDELEPNTGEIAPPRSVLLPRFERTTEKALRKVPATVAAQAMLLVGELAAGDADTWKRLKKAKDMRRPLYLARVGLHHRLLFQVEDTALVVVDLVTRANLDHAIDQRRSQA
jgi:hypothetical protein